MVWFVASHGSPARIHPAARPGRFTPELWKHDVAELFLTDPTSGRYFEFNLSPNGAWWSCEFTAPRVRAEPVEIAFPEVATFAELAPNGGWVAAMAIPRDLLEARLDFGAKSRLNVNFILGSPEQRFLSAVDLGGGEPDFHQPGKFGPVEFADVLREGPGKSAFDRGPFAPRHCVMVEGRKSGQSALVSNADPPAAEFARSPPGPKNIPPTPRENPLASFLPTVPAGFSFPGIPRL